MRICNLYLVIVIILAAHDEGQCKDFNYLSTGYFTDTNSGHQKASPLHAVSEGDQPKTPSQTELPYEYDNLSSYKGPQVAVTSIPPDVRTEAVRTKEIDEDLNSKFSAVLSVVKYIHESLYEISSENSGSPTSSPPTINCRRVMNSVLNENGEIIDSVKQVCDPIIPNKTNYSKITKKHITTSTTAEPMVETTTKWYYRKITSTTPLPAAVNCRRVMNSEFNENGEIIDSVTEVCDPPTTTTTIKPIETTTTAKPTVKTTPIPYVNVCWPVMNSVLDDNGNIIDSVTEVCTLVPDIKIIKNLDKEEKTTTDVNTIA